MKIKVEKPQRKSRKEKFGKSDQDIAMEFAKQAYKELGEMTSAIVLFGSKARESDTQKSDLDILIILDDIKIQMTPEIVQTYRILIEKIASEIAPKRLHIQVLHLTAWWGYVRAGDPIAINILRDGFALVDTGFFDPLQALLDNGAIRPSEEAVWMYYNMAPAALFRSESNIITATMDLYWACIDSAHAALMAHGFVPPNPEDVSDLLREKFVKPKILEEKYAKTMDMFYKLSKDIIHRNIKSIRGEEWDEYKELAQDFVKEMKKFVSN